MAKNNSGGIPKPAENESNVENNSTETYTRWLTKPFGSMIGGKDPLDPLAAQSSLKAGFLVTLGIGTLFIFIFKDTGIWNIAFCTAVMGLYWGFASSRTHTISARAVFADSFYYLGFLFTFIALISTMIGISSDDFRPETIVGQIGPALTTTVIGMAVRIYITQFDAITSEPEVEVLSGLGQLSGNLSSAISELDLMVRQHVKTSQAQQKTNTALTEKVSDQIERLDFTSAVSALKGFGGEINSLTTQIDLLSKVTGQAEAGAAKMTSSIFRATTELDKATNEFSRYRDIGSDYDLAVQSIGAVTEVAGQVANSLEAVNNNGIFSIIAELDAKAGAINKELEATDQHITRLSVAADEAQNKIGSSLAKLDESTGAVKGVSEKLADLDGLTQDLLDTNNIIRSLRTEVEGINTQISQELTKARDEISKTSGMAADLLKQEITPITNAINKISEDFDPIEKNLHNLDGRVRRSISDVLDFLNK
jgi:hypothetical protein